MKTWCNFKKLTQGVKLTLSNLKEQSSVFLPRLLLWNLLTNFFSFFFFLFFFSSETAYSSNVFEFEIGETCLHIRSTWEIWFFKILLIIPSENPIELVQPGWWSEAPKVITMYSQGWESLNSRKPNPWTLFEKITERGTPDNKEMNQNKELRMKKLCWEVIIELI